jgi:hypothetical protein
MKCKVCSRIKQINPQNLNQQPRLNIIASVNMVDVNVTAHNKTSEEQVFKD